MLPLAAEHTTRFEDAALVFGALLVLGALGSGLTRRSFLAMAPVFLLAGFLLGEGWLGVLDFGARSHFVTQLAEVALIVILFRDGLEVDGEMLQHSWRLPARKLAIAMPITAGIVALATHVIVGLDWTEAFLVGALTAALSVDQTDFVWWRFVLQDVGLGLVYGLAIGYAASWLLPRGTYTRDVMPAHQRSLYALGVAFLTFGLADVLLHGNGFIAVFVCAITLGVRRPDVRGYVADRAADIVEVVKLGVFVVFGSLLTLDGLFTDGWAAVAIVVVTLLIARPVAVWVALAGTRVDWGTKAFMSWFGPKGIATVTFSLIVLGETIPQGGRIFNLAALVVVCSVFAHSFTDTPGTEWIARRSEAQEDP